MMLKSHTPVLGTVLVVLALLLIRPVPSYSQAAPKEVLVVNTSADPVPVKGGILPLAPAKASDLIMVVGSGASAICGGIGNAIELSIPVKYGLLDSPGSFVIPAGKVFIVTGWQWFVSFGQGGGIDTVFLDDGGVTLATGITSLTSGAGGGSQSLPGPVALRPGRPICLASSAPFSDGEAAVYGFFAKDN